ncbi:MAG: endonuclease/exonuclease/phosphatase family protein [Clostridia bacterium]|nr:endonuclease/exonuclease/phosphatase family protein [Clostridia bacterium]
MKHKSFIKITAAVLLTVQLMTLFSCGKPQGDSEDTMLSDGIADDSVASDTTTAAAVDVDVSKYSVIRPEDCEKILTDASVDLRGQLSDACGTQLKIETDWVKPGETVDNESYEILVGATNRDASTQVLQDLGYGDYVIDVVGNKIVICGGSDASTVSAVEYFRANCVVDGKVVIRERIEHKKVYLATDITVGGISIEKFTIVYDGNGAAADGIKIAKSLQAMILEYTGKQLEIASDTRTASDNEIVIGETNRPYSKQLYQTEYDTYDYHIEFKDGKLYFSGGGCFGLQYCVNYLKDLYISVGFSVPETLSADGSMYGKQIYFFENGGDVRIMSNNVWDCDSNKSAWEALGENCSAKTRSVGLAATYMAYAPDVICLQEMSILMIGFIQKELKNNGHPYKLLTYTSGSDADNTCILYREDTLKLLDKGHHEFTYGNNGGSKSYTWGYFEQIETGKKFTALSTHMWYKSESAQAGSDSLRERQAAEIVAAMDEVIAKYDCPVFVMGDFNTRTTTAAFKVFINGGFKNTYSLASVFADNHRGRHTCNADGFALEESAGTYSADAIDHILLKNGGDTNIYTFDHARPYFYIKLSDHYPVFVDAKLD